MSIFSEKAGAFSENWAFLSENFKIKIPMENNHGVKMRILYH